MLLVVLKSDSSIERMSERLNFFKVRFRDYLPELGLYLRCLMHTKSCLVGARGSWVMQVHHTGAASGEKQPDPSRR